MMPERFSRMTRFRRSTNFWMSLNLGIAMVKTTVTRMSRITTARAIVHHMEEPLSIARMIPPTPMMGAKKNIRTIMRTSMETWVTSFVERVINEAVENLSNSVLEKDSTFSKTALRTSRANPADVREAIHPTTIAQITETSETSSMIAPVRRIYWFCSTPGSSPRVSYSVLTERMAVWTSMFSPRLANCCSRAESSVARCSGGSDPRS